MQKYKYTAVNLQKQKFSGSFIANDEKDLARQLAKQGLFLTSCKLYSSKPSAFFTTGTGKVSMQELSTFCRQFSIMITSGIAVVEGLEILKEQKFSSFFKALLNVIYDDVKSGVMFSEALNKHENVFPDFFRNMILVGEVAGNLEVVFDSMADYYERDVAIKKKTKSAFSYPLMLMGMTVGIVILMLLYVVPTFRESLSSLEITPTGLTKAVYDVSDFLLAYWLYILAGVVIIAVIFVAFGMTKNGKMFYDGLLLKIPLIKKIQIDLITARFARGFALMLSSGVDLVEALDTIVVVLGNRAFQKQFELAIIDIKNGMTLTDSFGKYNLFPPILMQMLAVGEKTATVDKVMERSCHFFDEQFESSLDSVTSKIQPAMLLIMGCVIGLLFIAIYSPMISIMTSL